MPAQGLYSVTAVLLEYPLSVILVRMTFIGVNAEFDASSAVSADLNKIFGWIEYVKRSGPDGIKIFHAQLI